MSLYAAIQVFNIYFTTSQTQGYKGEMSYWQVI